MAKKYQMALDTKTMIKDQSLLRHEDIKQHIQILPELAAYIPPLSPDEFKQLEENVKQNGCREALLVWETTGEYVPDLETTTTGYILIDGHNRYAICQKYHLDFKVHLMNFPSMEQVKFFMIDNQLGRRNLAPEQVAYLRGLRYLREKQEKGKYSREEQKGQNVPFEEENIGKKQEQIDNVEAIGEMQTTAQKLGKQFNVSEKTIKRDGIYAQGLEKLTPAFKQDILSGKTKVDKALLQRLGQADISSESIKNVVELEQVIQQKQNKSQSASVAKPSKKKGLRERLKQQLQELVSQLDEKKVNLNQVCNDIIECARRLKEGNE